ncbi:hypothetical protein SAMN04488523_105247 [Sulfitobacter brevis]|uniref:Lipoprotein n=1 Tax=Sulfitobacter brevis TaxID=74348 RepID=A0A1I1YK53_9RHOB|nr:hypothetical protein [Sulfitobacter brevis]SFE18390.1 hypothetical protein SAMN04488523_105247 [Sulfitobacter brevis]
MFTVKKTMIVGLVGAMVALSACSTDQVVDTTGSTVGFVTKTAVKGTIGAGKLAVRGVKKVAGSE